MHPNVRDVLDQEYSAEDFTRMLLMATQRHFSVTDADRLCDIQFYIPYISQLEDLPDEYRVERDALVLSLGNIWNGVDLATLNLSRRASLRQAHGRVMLFLMSYGMFTDQDLTQLAPRGR